MSTQSVVGQGILRIEAKRKGPVLGACPRMNDLLRKRSVGQLLRSISLNMNDYSPQLIKISAAARPAQNLTFSLRPSFSDRLLGVVCNVHGNELCGRLAVQRVLEKYNIDRGALVIIDGNQAAALVNKRYIESDMNRLFTAKLLKQKKPANDLLRAQYLAKTIPSLGLDMAIDFHSTSSETRYPFTVSFPGSEALTELCPAARIYGWPGIVEGSLIEWMNNKGIPSVVVEGGQHVAEKSVRVAQKTLLSVMSEHGLIKLKKPLKIAAQKSFTVLERVMVGDHDSFRFTRTFDSFERLKQGELIATDKSGDYTVPNSKNLYILMPSLQKNVAARLSRGAYYLMQRI